MKKNYLNWPDFGVGEAQLCLPYVQEKNYRSDVIQKLYIPILN